MTAPNRRARSTSYLRLVPVPSVGSLHLRFFDHEILGILTHYLKRKGKPEPRSYACRGDGCKMCRRTFPELQWKGYLCAEWLERTNDGRRWIPCVFEVTAHAEQEMRATYKAGAVYEFWREYRHADQRKRDRAQEKGCCCCQHRGQTPAAELVEPWPLDSVLFNVFGIRGLVPHLKSPLDGLEAITPRPFLKPGDLSETTPAAAPIPPAITNRGGYLNTGLTKEEVLGIAVHGEPSARRAGPLDAEDAARAARNAAFASAHAPTRNGTH